MGQLLSIHKLFSEVSMMPVSVLPLRHTPMEASVGTCDRFSSKPKGSLPVPKIHADFFGDCDEEKEKKQYVNENDDITRSVHAQECGKPLSRWPRLLSVGLYTLFPAMSAQGGPQPYY